jgi:hypothetical protein
MMSCDRSPKQAAGAATRSGIATGVSLQAFYLGAAVAGTVLGGWLVSRYVARRRPPVAPPSARPTGLERIKPLAAAERLEPIPVDQLPGQHCARCNISPQGQESWYKLGGRVYCQACAPDQAGKAGVSLVRPTVARRKPSVNYPQTGRRTTLKPRLVKVGPVENVAGYAVWVGKRETGLTLVPEVKLEASGQAKINQSRWYVNYSRAGKPVAGPYKSVGEARRMTSLLAHFDWTRGVENFEDEEIRAVTRMVRAYREDLDFRQSVCTE